MELSYRLTITGSMPRGMVEEVRRRFGEFSIASLHQRTVLEGRIADQPAIRALLNMVWDSSGEVLLLEVAPSSQASRV